MTTDTVAVEVPPLRFYHTARPRNERHHILGETFTFTDGVCDVPPTASALAIAHLQRDSAYTTTAPDWYSPPVLSLEGREGFNLIQKRARELGWEGLAGSRADMEAFVVTHAPDDDPISLYLREHRAADDD